MMVPEVDDMKGGNMHSPPSAPPLPHANLYQQEPSVIGVPVPPPSPGPGGLFLFIFILAATSRAPVMMRPARARMTMREM